MLFLEADRGVREVVHFVRELCSGPDIRLARLVSNKEEGVGIWLALRQPLQLVKIVSRMDSVSRIRASARGGGPKEGRPLFVSPNPPKDVLGDSP